MTAVLMFVADELRSVGPGGALRAARWRPGSYLALSHLTDDAKPPVAVDAVPRASSTTPPSRCTSARRPEIARFFDGLEVIPPYDGRRPGITYSGLWGAEDVQLADSDGSRWLYCAVARKP